MRQWVSAVMALAVVLPAATLADTPIAADARPPSAHFVDLMPDYWAFHTAVRGASPARQAALFTRMVAARHPEAYAPEVIGLDPQADYQEQIERRYLRVQALVDRRVGLMRKLSATIRVDLPRQEARFRNVFPDLEYRGDVYIMHSLGAFDGAVRTVGGRKALLFGVDMIAYVYGTDADPAPLFDHELFHIYQAQFRPGASEQQQPLVEALWSEGLATYVAQALNPHASDVSVFGLPRSTPRRVAARLPELARTFQTLLDSTSPDDYARWFLGSQEDAVIPTRGGYYLGYLVARRLARHYSLLELARLPVARVRPDIEAALASFANHR